MNVSISVASRFRRWVANRSVGCLLLIWLTVYAGIGLIFAVAYWGVPSCAVKSQNGDCVSELWNLLYFSFTTQSTLGYGDYLPSSSGRWLSVIQGFIGLTMNALVLGVAVFKALKRSNPLTFSSYLVYELKRHKFWMRFINIDADSLREADVRIEFIQFARPDGEQTDYDTQTSIVETDVKHLSAIPRLRLFAIRSISNGGHLAVPTGDFRPLVLSPAHFSDSTTKYLEVTIRGYFESTGDLFFCSKRYALEDIRCGRFDDVDNNTLKDKSDAEKSQYLSSMLDRTISTTVEECLQCPHHEKCELDVARKSRDGGGQS